MGFPPQMAGGPRPGFPPQATGGMTGQMPHGGVTGYTPQVTGAPGVAPGMMPGMGPGAAPAAAGPTGGLVPATTPDLQRYASQFVQLDTDRDGFVKVRDGKRPWYDRVAAIGGFSAGV